MKKIKVWIATLSLLFVMTTMFVPATYGMADGDQGTNPQTPGPPPIDPLIDIIILILIGMPR